MKKDKIKAKNSYLEYVNYFSSHIQNVKKAFEYLVENGIILNSPSLQERIGQHDESKCTVREWEPYENYFYGEEKTEEIQDKFDVAWNHHQKNNPHHWQYWVLIEDGGTIKALEMPYNYVVEMICDWWSFSWKIDNLYSMFGWYEENKDNQIMHEKTREMVEELLEAIKRSLDKSKETKYEKR
jgi:hypothetical protein